MNVALTRARSSLFILGNARTLQRSDDYWKQIIQDAESRFMLLNVRPPGNSIHTSYDFILLKIETGYYSKTSNLLSKSTLSQVPESRVVVSPIDLQEDSVVVASSEPAAATSNTRGSKRPEAEEQTTHTENPRKRRKEPTMFIPKKRT